MFNECSECEDGKLCELAADDNWCDSNSDSDSDSDVDMFKASVTVLKKYIYSKRVQNREYNRIKESLDHWEILVDVDYAKSYKNVHQNEIQSAYFGSSIFSIFTTCCYAKSLIDNGDDLAVVISESKDHNRIAALTCFKKVIEEVERVNAVKYTKVVVWSDGCAVQFRSRFFFRLLTDRFFEGIKLNWFHEPMRLDITSKRGGMLIYIKSSLPSRIMSSFKVPGNIQVMPFELNLRKEKWLFVSIYKTPLQSNSYFVDTLNDLLDFYSGIYDNKVVFGDFNLEPSNPVIINFMDSQNFTNLIKNNTCFKGVGSCIDLILTNRKYCLKNTLS